MENIKIGWEDLEAILSKHEGNRIFEQTLHQIRNPDDLLHVLSQYIHFNWVFPSCLVKLAGEIAAQQYLFRDPGELIDVIADQSYVVAAEVLSAGIDEYGERTIASHSTHRTLAQATLKAAMEHFGYDPVTFNALITPNEYTLAAVRKVRDGYGVNKSMNTQIICEATGFHLSSETLAGGIDNGEVQVLGEFRILDDALHNNFSELVERLESTEETIGYRKHPAYSWIKLHVGEEPEHRNAAMRAAIKFLKYYAGPESKARIKGWILDGFKEFTLVQTDFMRNLMR